MTGNTGHQEIPRERSLVVVPEETQKNWKNKAIFYPKLQRLIETFGVWEVNCNKLSKEWDVPKSTVYHWKDEILQDLAKTDIPQLAESLKLTSIANIQLLQKLIRTAKDPKVQIIGAKVHSELVEKFTNFCEKYGFKKLVSPEIEAGKLSLAKAYLEYLESEDGP